MVTLKGEKGLGGGWGVGGRVIREDGGGGEFLSKLGPTPEAASLFQDFTTLTKTGRSPLPTIAPTLERHVGVPP